MSKKNEHEKRYETPTRDLEYGGVGEEFDPETITVEDGADCFCGFEADEDIEIKDYVTQKKDDK